MDMLKCYEMTYGLMGKLFFASQLFLLPYINLSALASRTICDNENFWHYPKGIHQSQVSNQHLKLETNCAFYLILINLKSNIHVWLVDKVLENIKLQNYPDPSE